MFQVILCYVVCYGIQNLRAVIGPLPGVVCKVATFTNLFTGMNICLFFLAITVTKLMFVCIYGYIPNMDDSFLSVVIFNSVNTFTILAAATQFYLETKPRKMEVNIARCLFFKQNLPCVCAKRALIKVCAPKSMHSLKHTLIIACTIFKAHSLKHALIKTYTH